MKTPFAKGKRSNVFLENNIIIKQIKKDTQAKNALLFEAQFLKILNKHNIGPKLLSATPTEIHMQYIDGIRIGDYLQQAPKNKIKKTLLQIFNQLRTLDKLNINKFELTNPYKHIIITKKGPVLIDFERCRHTQHPKNISQFIQYIQTTRVQEWLQNKITLPTKLNKKAQTYKNNPTQKNYNEIIHWLLPFSEQVYTLCKQIPKGKITTYKEIAKKLNTKAYRAIGNALRKNPDPPIIPCHRVIASDGTIGGFMGQTTGKPIQKKITLLKKEGIPFEKNKIKNLSAYIHIY